jgi:radical SAM superfamily enzyme YgiQ (UPF0313 family)
MSDIAIYVQKQYAKKTYKNESYNTRVFPGIEMIRDVLERSGNSIDYCGIETVDRYKIILVSITSEIDWYTFIQERMLWKKNKYKVVVGGAGVQNIRPFLEFSDIFVFGRAENFVSDLISCVLHDDKFVHPSVCYADEFSVDKKYIVSTAAETYKYDVSISDGKTYTEKSIGCQRKCLFCNYTWTRKHVGETIAKYGVKDMHWDEKTILDLPDNPYEAANCWNNSGITVGLDGLTESIRAAINKPITDNMLRAFIDDICKYREREKGIIRMYNIIGYPMDTDTDLDEFIGALPDCNYDNGKFFYFRMHMTPFKPMPCTPCETWKASYIDYRDFISRKLNVIADNSDDGEKAIKVSGNYIFRMEYTTESLAYTTLWMLGIRGVESDASVVRKISSNKFNNLSTYEKRKTLENIIDVDRLFAAYTLDALPTRYLSTYVSREGMYKMQKVMEL